MIKNFFHTCERCRFKFWADKPKIRFCPQCKHDPHRAIDMIQSYRITIRKLRRGETVILPWLRDYPDIPTIKKLVTPAAKKKFDFYSSPSGLRVTRKISPQ